MITSWDEVVKPSPTSKYKDEIARLISYIGKEVGMNYGVNGSGAETKKISPILAKYGIKDYDKDRAIDVLKTKHGVIVISGKRAKHGWGPWKKYVDGHAFIADGYIKYDKKDAPYYLHLNYGWGSNTEPKDVYLLSAGKRWVDDADKYYSTIYRHKLFYYTYAYEKEKNWR
ncbi:MAG: hypothetical protein GX963_08850 [Bacteroidales bacterium]|nr:hypothetical protein [Bacteroidales bacterium]